MMAVETIIKHKINLEEPIKKRILADVLGGSDKHAHRFEVELLRGSQAVSLTGATVYGYFIRPDDITVKLEGGVSGDTAFVVLNEHCYVTPGRFSFAMKVQVGEVLHTVLLYEGCVAVTQGEGVVDDGFAIPSLTEWMNNIRKPNLLDNSDFRNFINQRGEDCTAGVWNYGIDRWVCVGSVGQLVWHNSGVISLGSMRGITQPLENKNRFIGKTWTLAVMRVDGVLSVVSGAFGGDDKPVYGVRNGLEIRLYSVGEEDNVYFNVNNLSNDTSTFAHLSWAALYEGAYTAETLPAYQPKGYAAELAECRRYYRVASAAYIIADSNGYCAYNFDTPMKKTPTVTVTDSGGTNLEVEYQSQDGFIIRGMSAGDRKSVKITAYADL